VKKRDTRLECVEQAVLVSHDVVYRFDRMKSKPDTSRKSAAQAGSRRSATRRHDAQAEVCRRTRSRRSPAASNMAKDLGNLPGNVCTPTYLAEEARALAKDLGLGVEIMEQN
jgi:leucyl aminopeptidase